MRTGHRLALAVIAFVAALVTLASPATALTSTLDTVASALRTSPLYNDPAAETALTDGQASDLLSQLDSAGTPIYIAVVPESFVTDNGGTARAALTNLANAVGRDGTYALVAGRSFWATSNVVSGTGAIASAAIAKNSGGGAYNVLSAFVTGVSAKAASGSSSGAASGSGSKTDSGGFPWGWVLVGGAAAGIGGSLYYSRRKAKLAQAAELESLRRVVDEDVTAFGEQVAAFDITDPRLDDTARADLQGALESYRAASDGTTRLKAASDAAAVTSHLDDGRFQMARVSARMNGEPLPDRRPPCFFDPRHGMSATDVAWAPPGGAERSVPACSVCAATVLRGTTPVSREVPVGAETRPYWQAGPMYGGYAGGYFNSFGAMLPSIMIGTMLGNALFPPMIGGMGGMGGGVDQAGMGGFGGGDTGGFGGDFGGGDFGGGDFGGGDF